MSFSFFVVLRGGKGVGGDGEGEGEGKGELGTGRGGLGQEFRGGVGKKKWVEKARQGKKEGANVMDTQKGIGL